MKNNAFFSSPKTTAVAILGFLGLVLTTVMALIDADPTTVPDWNLVFTEVTLILGFLFARDNDKSSEDVGVKEEEAKPVTA